MMQVQGSCHCGSVTYEADIDPAKVALCHCTDCQVLGGAAFSAFVPVPKEAFRLLRGEPKVYVKTAQSGRRRAQAFCAECGTRLYACAETDPQLFNLRVGTIVQRSQLAPRLQLWCRSALPWVMDLGKVEQSPTQPG